MTPRSLRLVRSLRYATSAAFFLMATHALGHEDGPTARALPADVQADVTAIAEHLSQVSDPAPALACDKAVENARWGVETMLEVAGKNLRSGYLSQADHDAAAPQLKALLAVLTMDDCAAATGERRAFYQCMSSDYNHVYACGKAHPFEP
jgi:hypothetical protein